MIDLKETFHSVNLKRKTYFDELLEDTDLNLMEIEILLFLKEYPENNSFTAIIKSKDYAKSYVSKAITHLVELEYLKKEAFTDNKKMYQLFLLEKSHQIIEEYNRCVERFRSCAFAGISDEDAVVFERVMQKISQNLMER
ncbi:MAG: hypothetical protein R3Y58_05790 [Eubacteriales bacterium]